MIHHKSHGQEPLKEELPDGELYIPPWWTKCLRKSFLLLKWCQKMSCHQLHLWEVEYQHMLSNSFFGKVYYLERSFPPTWPFWVPQANLAGSAWTGWKKRRAATHCKKDSGPAHKKWKNFFCIAFSSSAGCYCTRTPWSRVPHPFWHTTEFPHVHDACVTCIHCI